MENVVKHSSIGEESGDEYNLNNGYLLDYYENLKISAMKVSSPFKSV